MNIIDKLIEDHKNIKKIISKLETINKVDIIQIEPIWTGLDTILNYLHEPLEEEVFFTVLPQANENDTSKLMDGLISEHQGIRDQVKSVLSEIESVRVGPDFFNRLADVIKQILLHIDYEELELYPVARKYIDIETSERLLQKYQTPEREEVFISKVIPVIG